MFPMLPPVPNPTVPQEGKTKKKRPINNIDIDSTLVDECVDKLEHSLDIETLKRKTVL